MLCTWPISATDAVPGSVRIALQSFGYAKVAAPEGSRATFQPAGGDAGCSQRKAAARPLTDPRPAAAPAPTPRSTARGEATTSSRLNPSLIRSDVSIAVAGTAVVVGVMIATVLLRNSVPGSLV